MDRKKLASSNENKNLFGCVRNLLINTERGILAVEKICLIKGKFKRQYNLLQLKLQDFWD